MSRGINKIIIIGNLGRDVETRAMPSGATMAKFTVATTDSWDNKDGGRQERTEWHKVSAFGRMAEIAQANLKKGDQVYIEGSLRTSKWKDKSGQDRYTTEIVAKEISSLWGTLAPPQAAAKAPDTPFDDDIPW